MRRLITVEVRCGETTCYDKKARQMCRMVRTRRFGTEWHCHLYETALRDERGYLQRCEPCLTAPTEPPDSG
jgi:hypothetical protein